MTDSDATALPLPAFAGGTTAITTMPVVGTPRRDYAETFVPGEEALEARIPLDGPEAAGS
jgi:hypothetical protein